AAKVERVNVITRHGEMIHHATTGKIPDPAVDPSSVDQQHGNSLESEIKLVEAGNFAMNMDGDIVAGGYVKIGAVNERLLCASRQDAYHKHGQGQESQYTARSEERRVGKECKWEGAEEE